MSQEDTMITNDKLQEFISAFEAKTGKSQENAIETIKNTCKELAVTF